MSSADFTGVQPFGSGVLHNTDLAPNDSIEEPVEAGSIPEFKRVDIQWDDTTGSWVKFGRTTAVLPDSDDEYREYSFTVERQITRHDELISIHIRSQYLKDICQEVIDSSGFPGLSWHPDIVVVDPNILLAYLSELQDYISLLISRDDLSDKEVSSRQHLKLLLEYLESDHAVTLRQIQSLLSDGEIVFDLLWAVLRPKTILYTVCPTTQQPQVVQLVSSELLMGRGPPVLSLECQYVDAVASSSPAAPRFGYAVRKVVQDSFKGIVSITTLKAYPLDFHPRKEELRSKLISRGRRWTALDGMHHRQYDGLATSIQCGRAECSHQQCLGPVNMTGRVMIDKRTFKRIHPSYPIPQMKLSSPAEQDVEYSGYLTRDEHGFGRPFYPVPVPPSPPLRSMGQQPSFSRLRQSNQVLGSDQSFGSQFAAFRNEGGEEKPQTNRTEDLLATNLLNDEQLLLTTPVLYGFSLTLKLWLLFDVQFVKEIEWNDAAFSNLVLPPKQKELIQSLVEVHSRTRFDDFIEGKGKGLVFNLFGPPGIGKTMSAEATSEHVRKPLYVIGAQDLGTNPVSLDTALTSAFDVANTWSAIVLLDEADVYLEQRSVHDLQRNSLVAVFLRQLELYHGILFLTTNRVKTFDDAFQSRIHVSLRYRELDEAAKAQIWRAFLAKVGVQEGDLQADEWSLLAKKKVNGRQIKNSVRTAEALAISKEERLGYAHLEQVLEVLEQFGQDFNE